MPSENGSSLRPEQKLDCQSVEGLTMDLLERQRYLDVSSARFQAHIPSVGISCSWFDITCAMMVYKDMRAIDEGSEGVKGGREDWRV